VETRIAQEERRRKRVRGWRDDAAKEIERGSGRTSEGGQCREKEIGEAERRERIWRWRGVNGRRRTSACSMRAAMRWAACPSTQRPSGQGQARSTPALRQRMFHRGLHTAGLLVAPMTDDYACPRRRPPADSLECAELCCAPKRWPRKEHCRSRHSIRGAADADQGARRRPYRETGVVPSRLLLSSA
jgi:hypothetical protein